MGRSIAMKIILTLLLTLLWRASSSVSNSNNITTGTHSKSTTASDDRQLLYVFVTGPYPNPQDKGWDGGISLIPAVRLAFNQINNRTDILPGYKLETVEDDSGCAVKVEATNSFLRNVYYRPAAEQIVGIIGPACSGSTLLLKPILSKPKVSLIQIAPTSTSPELIGTNKNINSTTFTMLPPLEIIDSLASLMVENKWSQVATLYDNERNTFVQSQEKFQKRVNAMNNLYITYTSHVIDSRNQTFLPLEAIADRGARIVLLFMENDTARKVFCLAFNMSMLYPKYQWIIREKSKSEVEAPVAFKHEGVTYNCSKETMAKALNGTILNQFKLFEDDDTLLSPSNQTYKEYRELYNMEFWKHWNETSVQTLLEKSTKDKKSFLPSNWENTYYDAAWAFGIALARASSTGRLNLSQYKFGQPNYTRVIADELRNVTFEGATGPIDMGGSDRTHTTVVVSQLWTSPDSIVTETTLAIYSKGVLDFVKPNNFFIKDRFPEEPLRIHYGLSIIIITITFTVAICTVLLHIAFITWQNKKSIKATSPKISHLIFSGCYLFSLATILYAIQQSIKLDSSLNNLSYSVLCNIITSCLLLGYSLIFGTVLVKIWRMYKLFKHFRNKRPGKYLADNTLIIAVISLVIIDLIICVTWIIFDPWEISKTNTAYSDNLTVYITVSCKCNDMNMYYWIGGIAVYKGTIAILLLVFSILNRKIQRENFSHTKKVNVLVYSITLLSGVGFPLYFLLNNINIYVPFLILCTILIVTVVMCCLTLFLPPVLPILRIKLRRNCYKEKVTQICVHDQLSATVPV